MTGFGTAEGVVAGGRLRVEIRTVNHRYFNFSPRLPHELQAHEGEIRERVRREIGRGHVAFSARWAEGPPGPEAPMVDVERARMVTDQLKRLQLDLGLGGEVTIELVARQPEVFALRERVPLEVPYAEVEAVVAAATAECAAMRRREGEVISADLLARIRALGAAGERIAALAPIRLQRERDRLRRSVAELLDGHALDEARVAHELAVAADRLDITEELVRLRAHVAACEAALRGEVAAGKQLGFLAQELGREVNTIGSKANDATIAHEVVAMKGELERIREQLENLE
ncbi:MAG: YicC/YloC family endoribonuclease [Gemmatimonadales bacterium]|nr:YicC/YloC family endoribonuclease [Gemmatimonadales bacterium]